MEHHWKNRINDIVLVLCIIVPIDSKYGSGKYRHVGHQTFKKKDCVSFRVQNRQRSVILVRHISDKIIVVSVRPDLAAQRVCNRESALLSGIVPRLGSRGMKKLVR